jgi:hypothetical protein
MSTAVDPSAGQARSTRGRVPLYTPLLNDKAFDISVTQWTLSCSEGQHDEASISCVSTSLENTDGILDSAISFYYGAPPRTERFHGYVTNVTGVQKAQGQLSFSMTLLGASKMMFEGKPRFWRAKSASSVIYDLVNNSGLGFGGHTNSYLWKSLAQTDESDWEMVKEMASLLGWSIFYRYGVILLYDPVKYFKEAGTYTRLVSGLNDLGSTDRNLIEFSSEEVSGVIQDNMGVKYGYFTTDNKVQIFEQTGEFKGFLFDTDRIARDQTEAEMFMEAVQVRTDGWGEAGTARIWGDADLWPGQLVEVVTSTSHIFQPKGDGRWMVRAVGHQADNQSYQTILLLTRPSASVLTGTRPYGSNTTQYRPFWEDESPTKSRPFLSLNVDNQWTSSWADRSMRGLL